MAEYIIGRPHTRFRAVKVRDNAVSFGTGAFNTTLQGGAVTANRVLTLPLTGGNLARFTRGTLTFDSPTLGTSSIGTGTVLLAGIGLADRIFIYNTGAGTSGALIVQTRVTAGSVVEFTFANLSSTVAAGTVAFTTHFGYLTL
jgi:hypothetical protein